MFRRGFAGTSPQGVGKELTKNSSVQQGGGKESVGEQWPKKGENRDRILRSKTKGWEN